ncbi:MAG: hypothetical protein IJU50_08810 [Lachnospiraceae bacterium]|nr:hypothetical protein [Lachnospiraceae bacterium]
MPRITVTTNIFLNKDQKKQLHEEFKAAIEIIPCEKGSFVMTDFSDDACVLFGDEGMDLPCASIELAVIQDAFESCGKQVMEQVLFRMTESVMRNTKIPEERIFAYYRNSPLWSYNRKNIIGSLLKL